MNWLATKHIYQIIFKIKIAYQSFSFRKALINQGWKQFLIARDEMLSAYDRARELSRKRDVQNVYGVVAEAEFRKWPSNFLPKIYGVISGYIISPGIPHSENFVHYEVIIYDQLESPILWVDESPDSSVQGRSLAIHL